MIWLDFYGHGGFGGDYSDGNGYDGYGSGIGCGYGNGHGDGCGDYHPPPSLTPHKFPTL